MLFHISKVLLKVSNLRKYFSRAYISEKLFLPDDKTISKHCRLIEDKALKPKFKPQALMDNFKSNAVVAKHLDEQLRSYLVEDDVEPFRDALYYSTHAQRFRLLLDLTLALRKVPASILEVGAAHLHLSALLSLSGYSVVATDVADFVYHPRYAQRAKQFSIDHHVLDLSFLDECPIRENTFDIVIFSETLEHLNFSPLQSFFWMSRVLKPGGLLVITTPNAYTKKLISDYLFLRSTPFESLERYITKPTFSLHHRLYTNKEIAFLCQKVGLSVVLDSW